MLALHQRDGKRAQISLGDCCSLRFEGLRWWTQTEGSEVTKSIGHALAHHTDWPRSWHLRALTGDTTRLRVRWSHGSGWFLIASDTIRARLGRSLRIFGIAAVRLALLRSLCRGGQASVALALAGQTHPCPFVALALPEYSAFLRVDGLRVPAQSPELRVWPGK